VLTSIEQEYHKVYESATGFKHHSDKSYEQAGAGMPVLSKEALMKGTFAGAGMKMEREALTGENMQQMELIRTKRRCSRTWKPRQTRRKQRWML
jgi:hypothetical protein